MPKWLRSILIILLALAVAGGGAYGILTVVKNRSAGTVNVYAAENLCTNYSWANVSETEGRVTTDKIQSVYVSATQQVTEIYVAEGQEVKVGDPILAFDTTLSDLELERKRIEIEKLELEIAEAQEQRREMNGYAVYSGTVSQPEEEEEELVPVAYMPWLRGGDGSAETPYIFLWNDLCAYDEAFVNSILPYLAGVSRPVTPKPPAEEEKTGPASDTDLETSPGTEPETEPETESETEPETEPETELETSPETAPQADAVPEGESRPDSASNTQAAPETDTESELLPTPEPEGPGKPEVDAPGKPAADPVVYVVFEQREQDAEEGELLRVWQMNFWRADDNTPVFTLVQPAPDYDAFLASGSGGDSESYDDFYGGIYYTWSELQRMKAEADQRIKDLQFQLKKAELEYEIVEYELSNGVVYSRIDGVVKTLITAEEALAMNEPMVLISGGGGYYVQALLGELDLDYMQVGGMVDVQSWESGETLQGEIVEISEYPDDGSSYGYYWSQGNNNISKYPFTIFLPEDAPLRENEYVYITFSRQSGAEESVYLENAFLRRENGQSYVYALGEDGRLEQRIVTTGGSLWGSYTEILDGIDMENDHLAFPYGRDVTDGAKAEIASIDELYGVYY